MQDELKMSVSPICEKDGKRYAFVTFSDGGRFAEGKIPECEMISNRGVSEEEIEKLKEYMQKELPSLKKMAAGVNVFGAFMK